MPFNPRDQQQALFHGAGTFSALVLLSARAGQDLLPAVKKLMGFSLLGGSQGFPPNLHVLVGVKPELMGDPGLPGRTNRSIPTPFRANTADVLVQISAATASDRVFGMRLAADCFRERADARVLQGARLLSGQENFGFRDGTVLNANQVGAAVGSSPAGTWLLHQTMKQRIGEFMNLTMADRVQVMGRAPKNMFGHAPNATEQATRAALVADADNESNKGTSHYHLMHKAAIPLVRRGFPYQDFDNEGLAFLGASSSADTLLEALDLMATGDQLLRFADAIDGGLYFCPTPAALDVTAIEELPASTLPLRHTVALTSYTTTEAFVNWMLEMRAAGLFDPGPDALSAKLNPNLQPLMDQIYNNLNGNSGKVVRFTGLQRQAEEDASEINETLDDYLTFN